MCWPAGDELVPHQDALESQGDIPRCYAPRERYSGAWGPFRLAIECVRPPGFPNILGRGYWVLLVAGILQREVCTKSRSYR